VVKKYEKMKKECDNCGKELDCHWKSMESWVVMNNLVFC